MTTVWVCHTYSSPYMSTHHGLRHCGLPFLELHPSRLLVDAHITILTYFHIPPFSVLSPVSSPALWFQQSHTTPRPVSLLLLKLPKFQQKMSLRFYHVFNICFLPYHLCVPLEELSVLYSLLSYQHGDQIFNSDWLNDWKKGGVGHNRTYIQANLASS